MPQDLTAPITPPPLDGATPDELAQIADIHQQVDPWLLLMLRVDFGKLEIEVGERYLQVKPQPNLRLYRKKYVQE